MQVASGRFGVHKDYLNAGAAIEIKMGQGAKPGIGGHLPGEKIKEDVAHTRMIPRGTDAISPAPHHDIYSLEDLRQLIFSVKEATEYKKPVIVKIAAVHNVAAIASGVARSGGSGDEGNPVLGDDKANYTLLLKELRSALDEHFGAGSKILTVCAGASRSTLVMQDYAALWPYVDRVNLMTYYFAGSWNSYTGHQSPLYGTSSTDAAVEYILSCGVPAGKIAIGSPLYSHGWKMYRINSELVGAAAKSVTGDLIWRELLSLEKASADIGTPGWHTGYDEKAEAAYLWNDDPDSPDYLSFYTYDSSRSLEAKLNYINERGLGGLIVWEVHGDSPADNWPMVTLMHDTLHK